MKTEMLLRFGLFFVGKSQEGIACFVKFEVCPVWAKANIFSDELARLGQGQTGNFWSLPSLGNRELDFFVTCPAWASSN
ncbi:MAG: hypothetical protein PHV20_07880 [Bacteroidales bacterium]|nr:hypothetical protein [Bacteroidales bacterium]